MRVTIEEIEEHEEEEVVIRCHRLTPKHLNAIAQLNAQDQVIAYHNDIMCVVDTDDIFYFESVDKKTFLYTEKEVYEYRQKLLDIEANLGQAFIRVSRVVVLNWHKIDRLRPILNGRMEAMLENKERVIVSRQYVGALKKKLMG